MTIQRFKPLAILGTASLVGAVLVSQAGGAALPTSKLPALAQTADGSLLAVAQFNTVNLSGNLSGNSSGNSSGLKAARTGAGLTLKQIHQRIVLGFYTQVKRDAMAAAIAADERQDTDSQAKTLSQARPDGLPSAKTPKALTRTTQLDLTGLGPIRVGMTIAEAETASGLNLIDVSNADQSASCQYYEAQARLKGVSFMVVEDRIIRIDVWSDSPVETLSGARIGVTDTEIKALYPGQIEVTPNPFTQGQYLTYTPNTAGESPYRLVFETNAEGEVSQFRTGQFPAVTWPQGCS